MEFLLDLENRLETLPGSVEFEFLPVGENSIYLLHWTRLEKDTLFLCYGKLDMIMVVTQDPENLDLKLFYDLLLKHKLTVQSFVMEYNTVRRMFQISDPLELKLRLLNATPVDNVSLLQVPNPGTTIQYQYIDTFCQRSNYHSYLMVRFKNLILTSPGIPFAKVPEELLQLFVEYF